MYYLLIFITDRKSQFSLNDNSNNNVNELHSDEIELTSAYLFFSDIFIIIIIIIIIYLFIH